MNTICCKLIHNYITFYKYDETVYIKKRFEDLPISECVLINIKWKYVSICRVYHMRNNNNRKKITKKMRKMKL